MTHVALGCCPPYSGRVKAASAGVMPIASFVRFNTFVAKFEGRRQYPDAPADDQAASTSESTSIKWTNRCRAVGCDV